jgi:hypothetical protein
MATAEKKNLKSTKKIRVGHYLHFRTGLHITFHMGDSCGYWNIYEDEDFTKEWSVGINTKWQCIERIEKYSNQN